MPNDTDLSPAQLIAKKCNDFDSWQEGDLIRVTYDNTDNIDFNSPEMVELIKGLELEACKLKYKSVTSNGKIILRIARSGALSTYRIGKEVKLDPRNYSFKNTAL